MLRSVELKNFKLHRSSRIDTPLLTVLIGPNNSGKSSFSQALVLLRQTVVRNVGGGTLITPSSRQGTNEDQPFLHPYGEQIDPGSFEDIVHFGEREVRFEVVGSTEDTNGEYAGIRRTAVSLGCRDNEVIYHKGQTAFHAEPDKADQTLSWAWVNGPVAQTQEAVVAVAGQLFGFRTTQYPQFLAPSGISGDALSDPARAAALSAFAAGLAQSPSSLLKSVHPIYPLRGLEESGYPVTLGPEPNLDRVMLADRTLALLSLLAYRNDMLEQVSDWLENLIQVRIRTKLVPPRRVTLICESTTRGSKRGLFSNEGTGAGQLPFLLAPMALCPRGETLLVAEPEAHLHPRAQSELARLFIRIALEERKQFLIETHSEHVLNSLLHAVAKGDLSREDLGISYFERKGDSASVQRLVIDDNGRVQGGLPGFFDHSLAELTGYLETLKNK